MSETGKMSFGMFLSLSIIIIITNCPAVFAKDNDDPIIVKNRLRFAVPEDWPIEKRGGIVAPIPMEEYLIIKFKAVESQFDSIDQDTAGKFNEIKSLIESLKIDIEKQIKEIREIKTGLSSVNKDLKGLSADLDNLKVSVRSAVSGNNQSKDQIRKNKTGFKVVEKNIKGLILKTELLETKIENVRKLIILQDADQDQKQETEEW